MRAGRASLVDGFATVSDDELWLRNVHIAEYAEGTWTNHAPRRARKLLMHRLEIDRIAGRLREGGLALVPLSLYFTDGRVKVELGLGRGKKEYDKRQTMAKRDADREIERYAGRRAKGMRADRPGRRAGPCNAAGAVAASLPHGDITHSRRPARPRAAGRHARGADRLRLRRSRARAPTSGRPGEPPCVAAAAAPRVPTDVADPALTEPVIAVDAGTNIWIANGHTAAALPVGVRGRHGHPLRGPGGYGEPLPTLTIGQIDRCVLDEAVADIRRTRRRRPG